MYNGSGVRESKLHAMKLPKEANNAVVLREERSGMRKRQASDHVEPCRLS